MDILSLAMSKKFTEQKTGKLAETVNYDGKSSWSTTTVIDDQGISSLGFIKTMGAVHEDGLRMFASVMVRRNTGGFRTWNAFSVDGGRTFRIFESNISIDDIRKTQGDFIYAKKKAGSTNGAEINIWSFDKAARYYEKEKDGFSFYAYFASEASIGSAATPKGTDWYVSDTMYISNNRLLLFQNPRYIEMSYDSDGSVILPPVKEYLYSDDYAQSWKVGELPFSFYHGDAITLNDILILPPMGIDSDERKSREIDKKYLTDRFLYSDDHGITWKISVLPFASVWYDFRYENSVYSCVARNFEDPDGVVNGRTSHVIATSKDLVNWETVKFSPTSWDYIEPIQRWYAGYGCWLLAPSINDTGTECGYRATTMKAYVSFDDLKTIPATDRTTFLIAKLSSYRTLTNLHAFFPSNNHGTEFQVIYKTLYFDNFYENRGENTMDAYCRFPTLYMDPKLEYVEVLGVDNSSNKSFKMLGMGSAYGGNKCTISKLIPTSGNTAVVMTTLPGYLTNYGKLPRIDMNYSHEFLFRGAFNGCAVSSKKLPTDHFLTATTYQADRYVFRFFAYELTATTPYLADIPHEFLFSDDFGYHWKLIDVGAEFIQGELTPHNSFMDGYYISPNNIIPLVRSNNLSNNTPNVPCSWWSAPTIKQEAIPVLPSYKVLKDYVKGYYIGDGLPERKVHLTFTPSKVEIVADGQEFIPVFPKCIEYGFVSNQCNVTGVRYQYCAYR